MSYILKNFTPNIIAANGKHVIYKLLNNSETMSLHHFKSLVQAFFQALKQQYVTLTATHPGHILWRKCPLVFPPTTTLSVCLQPFI